MADPPRVLHVVESWRPVISGYTSRSWHVVQTQAAQGLARPRVLVTSRQWVYRQGQGQVDEAGRGGVGGALPAPEGVEVWAGAPSRRERRLRRWRRFYLDKAALRARVARAAEGCDLIHVHWSSGIGSAAADAAQQWGLPLVAEVRFDLAGAAASETLNGRLALLEGLARRRFERHLPRATGVVAASHSLAELLQQHCPAVGAKLSVVPNGVSPPPEDHDEGPDAVRGAVRRRLGVNQRLVVGSTSNMLGYEGLGAMLAAVAALPGAHALLVGGGPRRAALERRARRLGAPATFTGPVAAAEVPAYLAAMDVFAVPRRAATVTRYASPIKVIEAMAQGRAVAASAVGDLPLLLADDRGVLVPPGDAGALRRALGELAADPAGREAMGRRAAAWTRRHLTWPTVVGRYEAVYTEALR